MKRNSTKVTPLQKALATPTQRRSDNAPAEDIEVAIAWMQDRIGMTQAAAGLGLPRNGTVLYRIACYLRQAYRNGQITMRG